ncbi:MAG TPA: glucodextranase DOMON-like domain-containing protein, partial [Thermoanaerobaculia bacterium]
MHRSPTKLFSLAVLAALLATPVFGRSALFTLSDPRGDDHGDGNLIYPLNEELDPGDLDLTSLTARAEKDGTWFEATFARPVRQPGAETIDDLGTSLASVARFGFYTINLDIYIDTDRVAGSGGVAMLPGRFAEIDRAHAWEKAIVLTPRPHEARGELKRILTRNLNEDIRKADSKLGDAEAAELRSQIPGDVETRIFFPSQIRVRGNKITFFVPASFLGSPAKDTWSYVVATSGANVLQSFDLSRVLGRDPKDDSLMILPVSPGKWQDRFGGGRENAAIQPPLVDIIVPAGGKKQETILQ